VGVAAFVFIDRECFYNQWHYMYHLLLEFYAGVHWRRGLAY